MNSNQIGLFLLSRPFEPFAVHLADGRSFEVPQPDFVAMGDRALSIWYLFPTGELELIDVELISSMRTLGPVDPAEFIR
jgi:hypothetical protein